MSTIDQVKERKMIKTGTPSSICRECSLTKNDCCHTPYGIIIGILEAIKIHQETGLKYSDFIEYRNLETALFQDAFVDLLPSGKSIALLQDDEQACVFVKEDGCSIPQAKPLVCRVFPVWYDQEKYKDNESLILFIEERSCLLRMKLLEFDTINECCRFMGSSETEIKNLFQRELKDFELARLFENVLETLDIDSAFKYIEEFGNKDKDQL